MHGGELCYMHAPGCAAEAGRKGGATVSARWAAILASGDRFPIHLRANQPRYWAALIEEFDEQRADPETFQMIAACGRILAQVTADDSAAADDGEIELKYLKQPSPPLPVP